MAHDRLSSAHVKFGPRCERLCWGLRCGVQLCHGTAAPKHVEHASLNACARSFWESRASVQACLHLPSAAAFLGQALATLRSPACSANLGMYQPAEGHLAHCGDDLEVTHAIVALLAKTVIANRCTAPISCTQCISLASCANHVPAAWRGGRRTVFPIMISLFSFSWRRV